MTEQEAKNKVKEIYARDHWFILLSTTRANMMIGKSVPYIGKLEAGEGIMFVFTTYDQAKEYVDTYKYEVLEGNYPIGRIEKENELNSLHAIFNMALEMGVGKVDFNPCSEDAFGCNIEWFMAVNELDQDEISVAISEEEFNEIQQNNGQIPLRINPIDIYEFNNPYEVSRERADVILHHIFAAEEGQTFSSFCEMFLQEETLHENCFVMDYLKGKLIPMANQEKKEEDLQWFLQVSAVVQTAIWRRLFEHKLFVLTDLQTGAVLTKKGAMYVMYTDLFRHMGQYGYKPISGKMELLQLADEHDIEHLIVTDGPHGMAMLEKSVWSR